MKIYNTDREEAELKVIKGKVSSVCNPNGDIKWRGTMEDYYEAVRESDEVVCSEYQGYIGRGVFGEVEEAIQNGIPVSVIRKGKFYPVKGVIPYNKNDWKVKYGRVIIDDKEDELS